MTGSQGDARQARKRAPKSRKPLRRALVKAHRWCSFALGAAIVLEALSGCVLLYRGELYRSAHPDLWHSTASGHPAGVAAAVAAVRERDPGFAPAWASLDHGVYAIGDASYAKIFTVDPGTGRVNGEGDVGRGLLGFLTNMHDCAFGCADQSGYVPWLGEEVWGMRLGQAILVVVGLALLAATASGAPLWWPGLKRLGSRCSVRWRKGRFARDYDLHNVIGIVSAVPLTVWSATGMLFFLPEAKDAALRALGEPAAPSDCELPAAEGARRGPASLDEVVAAAALATGGKPRLVQFPTPEDKGEPVYTVRFARGYSPYENRLLFGGDSAVKIAAGDPTRLCVLDAKSAPAAHWFYDQVVEASHFGWMVDGWWRAVWFALGLAPVLLMATGVSTWLARRKAAANRRQAAARAAPTLKPRAVIGATGVERAHPAIVDKTSTRHCAGLKTRLDSLLRFGGGGLN